MLKPIVPKTGFRARCQMSVSAARHEIDLWGRAVAGGIKRYPGRMSLLRRKKFVSTKQRRFFFWALKHNVIRVPYKRTKTLSRATTNKTVTSGNRITTTVGINLTMAPYAPYVVGPAGVQSAEMATRGWSRIDELAKKEWAATLPKLRAAFHQGAKGRAA